MLKNIICIGWKKVSKIARLAHYWKTSYKMGPTTGSYLVINISALINSLHSLYTHIYRLIYSAHFKFEYPSSFFNLVPKQKQPYLNKCFKNYETQAQTDSKTSK